MTIIEHVGITSVQPGLLIDGYESLGITLRKQPLAMSTHEHTWLQVTAQHLRKWLHVN
jgi:hypothetical protein